MVLPHNAKWFYAVAGSGVVLGIFNYFQSEKKCVETSWTTNFEPSIKWDYNWDKRDIASMVKPMKDENDPAEQNRINEQRSQLQPTATRNIFLIRHGQYDEWARKDADRHLTLLGRKQAELVGQRLKSLDFNYTKLIRSTMTRALETGEIIHRYVPDVPIEDDDLLREGSPIPPEPPIGTYREEYKFYEDGARIEAAFRRYFHRADARQKSDSYEIIVCHANVIRYFFCR
ncbi:serine/threonine-protein phosphatase PGAM5, mitochondrial-like [Stegodyphus dumicola]|uniref:serine/threonine-protein phosphatase PGAM5, mitochondrial-like n=1 Tax=Stegodyphus dumicola TaxID=202533 RepID=UPI0015B018D0|nr:serine/threonine-protein phosphatase PGAM5, mitochondrial-like [Stegodyphus dumicola]XP_035230115.1 serine/threonine-protein phosphatase PGAM5, mitochondrial-like [Stegodyphus dumicola]